MSKLVTFYRGPFAGRERQFCLRLGEVAELERLCNAGIGKIAIDIATHQFSQAEIRETVRLGLQGGGSSEPEATALTMTSFDGHPLAEHIELAAKIVEAYLNGIPEELKKKPQAPGQTNASSRVTSPTGTAPVAE